MGNLTVLLLGCHEFSLSPGHVRHPPKPITAAQEMGRGTEREASGCTWLCQGSPVSSSSLSFPIVNDFTGDGYWEMTPHLWVFSLQREVKPQPMASLSKAGRPSRDTGSGPVETAGTQGPE